VNLLTFWSFPNIGDRSTDEIDGHRTGSTTKETGGDHGSEVGAYARGNQEDQEDDV
jgi:hypothetical protein